MVNPFLEFHFGFSEVVEEAGDVALVPCIEVRGKLGTSPRDASEVRSEGLLGMGLEVHRVVETFTSFHRCEDGEAAIFRAI